MKPKLLATVGSSPFAPRKQRFRETASTRKTDSIFDVLNGTNASKHQRLSHWQARGMDARH